MSFVLDQLAWPQSIRGINSLEREVKEAIYLTLIPDEMFSRFGIQKYDSDKVRVICPDDTRAAEIDVFSDLNDKDPILYVHLADTLNYQIAVLLLTVNDVSSPRFNVDFDEEGRPTRFGTFRRNVSEERRAITAGLSPGQIYRGLRISRKLLRTFETFVSHTGHDLVIIEPLTYSNAIVYERLGFAYIQGRSRMEWIDRVLRPGGDYFDRLDNTNPFRLRDAWKSVRGRAWSIHDGVLGEPFGAIRMYKRIGHHAGMNTFPDATW